MSRAVSLRWWTARPLGSVATSAWRSSIRIRRSTRIRWWRTRRSKNLFGSPQRRSADPHGTSSVGFRARFDFAVVSKRRARVLPVDGALHGEDSVGGFQLYFLHGAF